MKCITCLFTSVILFALVANATANTSGSSEEHHFTYDVHVDNPLSIEAR